MGQISSYLAQQLPQTRIIDDRQEIGIGNFTAFVRVRESFTKTNAVTSTPLEDGSFANDHINNNPLQLSIEGEVSDIHIKSSPLVQGINRSLAEISNVTKYLLPQTPSQVSQVAAIIVQGVDIIRKLDSVIDDTNQVFDLFGNKSPGKNPQEQFIDEIDKLMDGKQVITVEMPFRLYQNMVITSVSVTRDNTTNKAIQFKLSAQQIRIAKTIFTDISALYKNPASGGISEKTSGVNDKGINKAEDVETSLLSRFFGS